MLLNLKRGFWAAIALAILLLGYQYNRQKQEIERLTLEKVGLEKDLQAKTVHSGTELKTIVRQEDGTVKTVIKYVPAEGSVVTKYKLDIEVLRVQLEDARNKLAVARNPREKEAAEKEVKSLISKTQPDLEVKDKGWTFRVGGGAVWDSEEFSPSGDLKWAYWGRYSLTSGVNKHNFEVINLTRHVDDLVPWVKMQNLEIKAGLGKPFRDVGWTYQVGARCNF